MGGGGTGLLEGWMSRLCVRVTTGFYTHRKTARLRLKIGDDAYWVVPRLWAYAAENQPDGNFSGYSSEELAELIGCSKHAASIRQALLDTGWMDGDGMIHDWSEHNGYHEKYSKRAKNAADARWSKEAPPTPPEEGIDRKRKVESGGRHTVSMLQASVKDAASIKNGEIIGEIEKRLSALFGRNGERTTYLEQSSLSEVSRRPNVLRELSEIERFKSRPKSYFPQSLEKLVTQWQVTLDRSRNQQPDEDEKKRIKNLMSKL
jgi:hypothetical protein